MIRLFVSILIQTSFVGLIGSQLLMFLTRGLLRRPVSYATAFRTETIAAFFSISIASLIELLWFDQGGGFWARLALGFGTTLIIRSVVYKNFLEVDEGKYEVTFADAVILAAALAGVALLVGAVFLAASVVLFATRAT